MVGFVSAVLADALLITCLLGLPLNASTASENGWNTASVRQWGILCPTLKV